jgi:antagonist of KipI
MGVRLEGPILELTQPSEMISSAVNVGVVQVPTGGQPIVLLCSRQTVGGYPRLAAVAAAECGHLAQLKQGDDVAFEEISLGTAHRLLLDRERDFTLAREAFSRRTS